MSQPGFARHALTSGALAAFALGGLAGQPASRAADQSTYTLQWLQVIPQHPQTLFIGGTIDDPSCDQDMAGCGGWALRSTDGGHTWHSLSRALTLGQQGDSGNSPYQPVVGADGQHVLLIVYWQSSPDGSAAHLSSSADGGAHWTERTIDANAESNGAGAGAAQVVFSPVNPSHVYATEDIGDGHYELGISDDWGATWNTAILGNPDDEAAPNAVLPDPTLADTVYALAYDDSGSPEQLSVERSQDAGNSWSSVKLPDAGSGATLQLDPHEPGMLELITAHTPRGQVYLSADHGQSWRLAPCPGRLPSGSCPTAVTDNLFGAGHAYALGPGGVFRFDGAGAARNRLAISARLPIPPRGVRAVAGGMRYGDPVYLLGSATAQGALSIYRSDDAGQRWHRLRFAPPA
jgi:hypothetical protein